jgi:hypothetical protein
MPGSLGDLNAASRRDYTITVPQKYNKATLVELEDKIKWGGRTDISNQIKNGALTLSISEKPVFVILGGGENTQAVQARPTSSTVMVNGKKVAFDAYNINGSNYFKLRDLAYALSGTQKQFEVGWDSADNAITLTSKKPYTAVGGEMEGGAGAKEALPTTSRIYKDGKEARFDAYNIGGNNYFKLRDIGEAFDFGVDWDEAAQTISIDTRKGYTP